MDKTRAFLLCLYLTFALASILFILYLTAQLIGLTYALEQHQPPTQANDFLRHIEQERINDLQREIQELREGQDELMEIFSGAVIYEITAYTDSCGNGDGYTATMTRPTVGRTIAVDPRKIPLGSRVWIEGLGWHIAEDVGAAVKGNVIDYYIGASVSEALRFGRQRRRVVVL